MAIVLGIVDGERQPSLAGHQVAASDMRRDGLVSDVPQRWWKRIQWIDVVLIVIVVVLVLYFTMEMWLPHSGPE